MLYAELNCLKCIARLNENMFLNTDNYQSISKQNYLKKDLYGFNLLYLSM